MARFTPGRESVFHMDVRSNVNEVLKWVTEVEAQQIPFATSVAINRTITDIYQSEGALMRARFDRPAPYTLNSLWRSMSTKKHLVGAVYFKEGKGGTLPAKKYLNPNITGGARNMKSHERRLYPLMQGYMATVPGEGANLDAHGNIKGSEYTRILSQLKLLREGSASGSKRSRVKRATGGYFIPSPSSGLRAGVYKRMGQGSVSPVLIFVRTPVYKPIFPFYDNANAVAKSRFPEHWAAAFSMAIRTRKPR